jgi:hypothetical protein
MKLDDKKNRRLSELLRSWKGIEPSPAIYERLKTRIKKEGTLWKRIRHSLFSKRAVILIVEAATVVAIVFLFNHLWRKPEIKIHDDLTVANFYLKQHHGVTDHLVSRDSITQPIGQGLMSHRDVLYYEFIDDFSKLRGPGFILRGPQSSFNKDLSTLPAISKGQTLSLSQALKSVNFELIAPPQLHTGYELLSIRKIEDFNCLHLLYSDGFATFSLFQQPSDSKDFLGAEDFREYVVFSNKKRGERREGNGTGMILAWHSRNVFFVLVGQQDLSELMKIAQSVSDTQERNGSIKTKR